MNLWRNDMSMRILVVEDDINISNMLHEVLEREGFDCTQAFSGTEALLCTKMQQYELIILDLMLPGISGEDFIKQYCNEKKTPIIVLSAKDQLDTKVELLTIGADDYLTKPFEIRELIARVKVQLRRYEGESVNGDQNKEFVYKNLSLKKSTLEVKVENQLVNLTRQEFKILELLLSNPNKIFSKQDVYDYAWDDYYIGEDKTINVHISNIRSKLKKYSDEDYIDTVWGIGFKLSK